MAQNGQPRLVARDLEGRCLGLVCFRCACAATDDALAERLLSGARRLRPAASRLERLVEGRVAVSPAATAARATTRDGL